MVLSVAPTRSTDWFQVPTEGEDIFALGVGPQLMGCSFPILRWWPYKLVFVVLFVLPAVPAIAIFAAERCLGDGQVCLVAHSVSKFGAAALKTGSRHGFVDIAAAAGWLVVCYLTVSLGWRRRITSRLFLAFVVTLIFAFFPYVLPFRALGLVDATGQIGLIQSWLLFIGFPIGYTAFLFYVVLSGLGIEP